MRVVAGELRGRKIEAPPGLDTRPTTDKVREAIFNALGSLGLVVGATVADLYAGSGALGIEALSRGAEECTFVERDRAALRVVRSNVDRLGVADRSRVVGGDVMALASSLDVDLVLADPPYDTDDEAWAGLLSRLRCPFVVAEGPRRVEPIDDWSVVRERRYGRSWVTFLERDHQYD